MEFLKYFITEDVYLIPDNRSIQKDLKSPESKVNLTAIETTDPEKKEVEKKFPLTVISYNLESKEEKLLHAILNAVKLDVNNIELMENVSKDPNSDKVIIFNTSLIPEITPYMITNKKGRTYLIADDLITINNDVEKKRKLWSSLQQMFSL